MEINFASRECNVKIVYYGPGLSGKTTNLEVIHQKAPEANRGKLTALATDLDRTLYFDYMPLELGKISGLTVRMRLFTVPGQVYYNSTRKIVLRCVDGVVFVADSQEKQKNANLESLENLRENLLEQGLNIEEIPLVLQYNKRDLPNIMPIEVLDADLNSTLKASTCPAIAPKGDGVFQCLKLIANLTMAKVEENIKSKPKVTNEKESQKVAPSFTEGKIAEKSTFIPPKKKTDVDVTQRRSRFSITGKWKREEKPSLPLEEKVEAIPQNKDPKDMPDPSTTAQRMSFVSEKKPTESTGATSRLSGTTINRVGENSPFARKVGETSSFSQRSGESSSFGKMGEKKTVPPLGEKTAGDEKKSFFHAHQEPKKAEETKESFPVFKESMLKDRLGKAETEKKEFSLGKSFAEVSKPKIPGILPTPLSSGKSDKFAMPLFQGSLSNASSNASQKEPIRASKESAPSPLSFSSFLERKKELKNQNQEEDKSEI